MSRGVCGFAYRVGHVRPRRISGGISTPSLRPWRRWCYGDVGCWGGRRHDHSRTSTVPGWACP